MQAPGVVIATQKCLNTWNVHLILLNARPMPDIALFDIRMCHFGYTHISRISDVARISFFGEGAGVTVSIHECVGGVRTSFSQSHSMLKVSTIPHHFVVGIGCTKVDRRMRSIHNTCENQSHFLSVF